MAESKGRVEPIAEKIEAGERLSFDEGVELFERWRLTATRQFYLSLVICDSMAAI
jgi:hypothetical protein